MFGNLLAPIFGGIKMWTCLKNSKIFRKIQYQSLEEAKLDTVAGNARSALNKNDTELGETCSYWTCQGRDIHGETRGHWTCKYRLWPGNCLTQRIAGSSANLGTICRGGGLWCVGIVSGVCGCFTSAYFSCLLRLEILLCSRMSGQENCMVLPSIHIITENAIRQASQASGVGWFVHSSDSWDPGTSHVIAKASDSTENHRHPLKPASIVNLFVQQIKTPEES